MSMCAKVCKVLTLTMNLKILKAQTGGCLKRRLGKCLSKHSEN